MNNEQENPPMSLSERTLQSDWHNDTGEQVLLVGITFLSTIAVTFGMGVLVFWLVDPQGFSGENYAWFEYILGAPICAVVSLPISFIIWVIAYDYTTRENYSARQRVTLTLLAPIIGVSIISGILYAMLYGS